MTVTDRSHILWFDEIGEDSLSLVGGKNASLGEMMRRGVRVPAGFAVTTDAYDTFIEHAGLRGPIHEALWGLDPHDAAAVELASVKIRGMIESAPLPRSLEDELATSYAALAEQLGEDRPHLRHRHRRGFPPPSAAARGSGTTGPAGRA